VAWFVKELSMYWSILRACFACLAVATLVLHATGPRALGKDAGRSLWERFQSPGANARPWVRWWWNGNAVKPAELKRELRVLSEAGFGGVEINPIAMPRTAKDIGAEKLTWLGPQWQQAFKAAVDEANELGMKADLLVGTGWPFGGRFLEKPHQIQTLHFQKKPLKDPGRQTVNLQPLIGLPEKYRRHAETIDRKLARVIFVPNAINRPDQLRDLTDKAQDRQLTLTVPEAGGTLHVGTRAVGFRQVVHGAPGGDGPVLDHYDKEAVQTYLSRLSKKLNPLFDGRMGNGLRAMFCDSIELEAANWTEGFGEVFAKRRGYRIEPYLPWVIKPEQGDVPSGLRPTLRRVRYDYARTIANVFHERFVQTFVDWSDRQGMQSRYQAYGVPWLVGMLEGYMMPSIPEGDTWLHFTNDSVGPTLDKIRYAIWNKYAASGAHLSGRSIVSCESMTNVHGVFRTTLNYIKQASDLNFITGANHAVLHGFNYSPPEAGVPGWVRYGTYFSEHNPWWAAVKRWVDYKARLSAVLQNTQAQANVAIIGNRPGTWQRVGLRRRPLIKRPRYFDHLWQAFTRNGVTADVMTGPVLQKSTIRNGQLHHGPMAYDLLVLTDAKAIEPATAEKLKAFAKAGGRIAFVGHAPYASPGLKNHESDDKAVRRHIQAAREQGQSHVRKIEPPKLATINDWADDVLDRFEVRRDVSFDTTNPRLFQIHHETDKRSFFLLVNSDRRKTQRFTARFDVASKQHAWQWDPHTGRRWGLAGYESGNRLKITLRPLESKLIVFSPKEPDQKRTEPQAAEAPSKRITGPWRVNARDTEQGKIETTLSALRSLPNIDRFKGFAGAVTYETDFDVNNPEAFDLLTLGRVDGVAKVSLNGQQIGVRWFGRPLFDIGQTLNAGRNTLTVTVRTTLFNKMRLSDKPAARRWTRNQEKPQPMGVLGPIRLRAGQ
jgi:hypothetical protein